MNTTVKVTAIGNSVGIILSKEIMARLHVEKGDQLFVTETPDGVKLSAYDQQFADEMEVAKRVMRKHRDVLRKLAE